MIIIIIDKPETSACPWPRHKVITTTFSNSRKPFKSIFSQYSQSRIYLIDHLVYQSLCVRFWSTMEEWNFVNSIWTLSASVVFILLIWIILSRKFLKYVLDWSGFVVIRGVEIEEAFCTTAYLRGDLSSSMVNIDEMKVMQSFLKDLTDLLVTVSFLSQSFISAVAPKPMSSFLQIVLFC